MEIYFISSLMHVFYHIFQTSPCYKTNKYNLFFFLLPYLRESTLASIICNIPISDRASHDCLHEMLSQNKFQAPYF